MTGPSGRLRITGCPVAELPNETPPNHRIGFPEAVPRPRRPGAPLHDDLPPAHRRRRTGETPLLRRRSGRRGAEGMRQDEHREAGRRERGAAGHGRERPAAGGRRPGGGARRGGSPAVRRVAVGAGGLEPGPARRGRPPGTRPVHPHRVGGPGGRHHAAHRSRAVLAAADAAAVAVRGGDFQRRGFPRRAALRQGRPGRAGRAECFDRRGDRVRRRVAGESPVIGRGRPGGEPGLLGGDNAASMCLASMARPAIR